MITWRFRSTGLWHWQRVDDRSEQVLAESHAGFPTLLECVNDARRHGYTARYEAVSDAILEEDSTVQPRRLRPPPCTRY